MVKRDTTLDWKRQNFDALQLGGTTAIIVGGTGGLGRAFAGCLADRGAAVTVVGRTFRDEGQQRISFVKADLSSMREARRIARELPAEAAGLLIFTAGIIANPKRQVTDEGVERDMAVSYLNRFVMLREMAPRLGTARPHNATERPRVFIMAYPGAGHTGDPDDLNAERNYRAWPAHLNTVAANEALTLDAARRDPAVDCFGLNPGVIRSGIRSNFLGEHTVKGRVVEALLGWFAPSVDDYARRLTPLLVAPELKKRSGMMFDRRGNAILRSPGLTAEQVDRFTQSSIALVERAADRMTRQTPPGAAAVETDRQAVTCEKADNGPPLIS